MTSQAAVQRTKHTPSRLDAWTNDSNDLDWMAEFRDFADALSDNENLDSELFDDRSTRLSEVDDLDANWYAEFTECDNRSP